MLEKMEKIEGFEKWRQGIVDELKRLEGQDDELKLTVTGELLRR